MTKAIGIDISRYNTSFDPALATGPVDFVIQKATEGLSYVDLEYDNLWRGVSQIPVRGAYHYQRSGLSWLAQADHFLETTRRHSYHIHALDVEEVNNAYTDTYFADAKRIIDYWRQNAYQKVVLYTNGSTYAQMYLALARLYGQNYAAEWMSSVDLWLASPGAVGVPYLPKYRTTWTFHQYSWSGLNTRWGTGKGSVDENVFNGTVTDLYAWLGAIVPPKPPEEGKLMRYEAVSIYSMSLRPDHNTSNTPLRSIPAQSKMQGDVIWEAAGEKWLNVIQVNGVPLAVPGWVAIISASRVYCSLVDSAPHPPPAEEPPAFIVAHWANGQTRKYLPE
jgi:GH25 family lysozyme M1 (1,4-beta-N-acetylmuramidase)